MFAPVDSTLASIHFRVDGAGANGNRRNIMMTRLIVACVAQLVLGAGLNFAAVQGELGFCSGTAAIGECSNPSENNLDCLGQCPAETTCQVNEFQSGSTTYWACACEGSGGSATQGSCCHLIVIQSGSSKVWGARGACPSCGSQGSCQLDTSGCQAVCS